MGRDDASLTRRQLIGAGGLALAACGRPAPAGPGLPPARWTGASVERGHRLRSGADLPPPAVQRRAAVLIVGSGIAGLAAARAFARRGVDDVQLLELEDHAGGNSRGHAMAGIGCPLGAHYLPLPGPQAHEVAEWLHELGLLRSELGRTVADERHLCFSLQERLFVDGAWVEGLLPPLPSGAAGAATLVQYRRFANEVRQAQALGFALPSFRAPWTPALAALDALPFDDWLARQGLDDPRLRWYLDYCCRDDYGAGSATVSAWAGLHYFASRQGFQAPGDADAERDAVFTWPEGNAWLAERLAAPWAGRLQGGRTVLRVSEGRHAASVMAWDEATARVEQWTASTVILAVPIFIAARIVESPSAALRAAAAQLRYAPWLVANALLDRLPLPRTGAPPAWDNVVYGSSDLGYVDAGHQRLDGQAGPTVLSFYRSLPQSGRAALLADSADEWAARVLHDAAALHPDLYDRVQRIDLQRWGHAMSIPLPGVHGSPALAALRAQRARLRFAHSDLAGYSVFEEAFTAGTLAASG
jgi:monoamine oxidase